MMTSIEREKIANVGRGMIASGRPFKGWQLLLKDGPSSVLWRLDCQSMRMENSSKKITLKYNLSEGEESWRNDDKMLLLDLTSSTAVWWQEEDSGWARSDEFTLPVVPTEEREPDPPYSCDLVAASNEPTMTSDLQVNYVTSMVPMASPWGRHAHLREGDK